MPDDPNKTLFSFTVPKDLIADLKKGCDSYNPIPNVPFKPQLNDNYDSLHAAWCINAIIYAYKEYCDKTKRDLFPPEVEDATPLYWHEDINLLSEKVPCGYIGTIKPIADDNTNRIIIAFRGTEKISEWLENIDWLQKDQTFNGLDHSVAIHAGFWDILNKKANLQTASLQEQLDELIPQYLKSDVPNEINITGHSLGAAVSVLVSIDTILKYPKAKVVTFIIGAPRVGGPSMSELVKNLSMDKNYDFVFWRLVNTEDIVPTVPAPVVGDVVYSQVYVSKVSAPNRVGSVTFSDNLGHIGANHHPLLYYYANDQLAP
jgi:predicted lipase